MKALNIEPTFKLGGEEEAEGWGYVRAWKKNWYIKGTSRVHHLRNMGPKSLQRVIVSLSHVS